MSPLPFDPALSALPRGILIAGGVVISLLVFSAAARLTRRRQIVVIGESEAIRTAIIQLSRIADSLERLSFSLEIKPPVEGTTKDSGRSFSVLNR